MGRTKKLCPEVSCFLSVPCMLQGRVFTPPEATNTGPGFNRGSGGGARGCSFEKRVGAYALTEGGHFLELTMPLSVCVATNMAVGYSTRWITELFQYIS